jgi:hypothetical protein
MTLYLFFNFFFQLILDYFEIFSIHCRYDFGLDMDFDHFDMCDFYFFGRFVVVTYMIMSMIIC